ncbi:MAG: DUF302 domain-containing protein [Acidobacteriota bacterium]|nr:DUF302 domain-containing protein [Acidobacteriota bacterium]MDQ7087271.1 DUF302 domain-containing protein [Acidobacteriota bacterium]
MNPMSLVVGLVAGSLVGMILAGVVFVALMRRKMVQLRRSALDFEGTLEAIRKAVGAVPGWSFPMPELDFLEKLQKKGFGVQGIRKARIFFLCNPSHASEVVGQRPEMIGIMPCSWGVLEDEAGRVYLARMNIPLLSRMFTGVVGSTMRRVAEDEERMLAAIEGTSAGGRPACPPAP